MNIRMLLKKHEGIRLKPYKDSANKLTIGVGRNLEDRGISEYEANFLLDNDIKMIIDQANEQFYWFDELSRVRKDVILSMIFNLGLHGFMEFKRMIIAVSRNDFELASKEMINSQWSADVGKRAYELSEMMRTDEYFKGGENHE